MSSFELLLDAMMRKPSPARDWSSDAIFSSSHRALSTHWFSSTGINDDDFKFAKAVKKAAAKASATDEL